MIVKQFMLLKRRYLLKKLTCDNFLLELWTNPEKNISNIEALSFFFLSILLAVLPINTKLKLTKIVESITY